VAIVDGAMNESSHDDVSLSQDVREAPGTLAASFIGPELPARYRYETIGPIALQQIQ
jgi:hypothetical protein